MENDQNIELQEILEEKERISIMIDRILPELNKEDIFIGVAAMSTLIIDIIIRSKTPVDNFLEFIKLSCKIHEDNNK